MTDRFLVAVLCGAMVSAATGDVSSESAVIDRIGVTNAAPSGGLLDAFMFYSVATAIVVSAVGVCLTKNIVRMAVWLFVCLGSVATAYFLLAANFLGAIQLIVYAGGTLILLIFGVMLTSKSPWVRFDAKWGEVLAAGAVCVAMLVVLSIVLRGTTWQPASQVVPGVAVADLGVKLLTAYVVPFEVAGLLLMIVMVGAAHLARQDK
ncbi:MAG: NADH-quinone oxidoreductase subunit J [Planctomycetota bacterium]